MDKKAINKQIRRISNSGSLLLVIFFAVVLPGQSLLKYMFKAGGYGSIWQNSLFVYSLRYIMVYLVTIPLLLLLYYKCLNRQNGLRLRDAFGKSQRSKGWVLKWAVIGIGSAQLFGKIMSSFFTVEESTGSMDEALFSQNNEVLAWIIYAVPLVLFAPFFEELLFRATIYRNNEPMGQLFAAVVSGTAFGLWHINTGQIFNASMIGVLLCLIFTKTGSIASTMFIHFLNNFISFLRDFSHAHIGSILSASDKEFMIKAMFHKQPVFSVLLALTFLTLAFLLIAGPIMLIVQIVKKWRRTPSSACTNYVDNDDHVQRQDQTDPYIVKKKKSLGFSKGEFPYGAWKKTLVFFSAPLTIIAFLAMLLLTFVF